MFNNSWHSNAPHTLLLLFLVSTHHLQLVALGTFDPSFTFQLKCYLLWDLGTSICYTHTGHFV